MGIYFHNNLREHATNIVWLVINAVLQTATAFLLTFSTNAVFELNMNKLLFWSGINASVWIAMLISSYFQEVFQARLIQMICVQIRENMSNKMANETYLEFHQNKVSQHISNYTNDITTLENQYLTKIYSLVENTVLIGLSIIALAYFHYLLLIVTIVLAVIILVVPNIFMKKLQSQTNMVSESNSKLVEAITNILKGFNVLYSYNRKSGLPDLIKKESEEYADSKINYTKISAKVNNSIGAVSVFSQIILDIVASILAISRLVTPGVITSIGNIASGLFNALSQIGNDYSQIKSTQILFDKLHIKQSFKNIDDASLKLLPGDFEKQLVIKNLTYSVDGQTIFKALNLAINKGEKVLIKGASGVGKSTLLKIIGGQLTDYEGEILIDGQDIKTIPYLQLNEMITYIDQQPYLFSESIQNNVTLFKSTVTNEKIKAALKLSNVDFITQVNDDVLDNGHNLSVGQQQRIAIARYYLKDTPIALLDEGTSALDHQNSVEVEYNLLKDKSRTLLEVAHHFNEENSHLFTKVVTL